MLTQWNSIGYPDIYRLEYYYEARKTIIITICNIDSRILGNDVMQARYDINGNLILSLDNRSLVYVDYQSEKNKLITDIIKQVTKIRVTDKCNIDLDSLKVKTIGELFKIQEDLNDNYNHDALVRKKIASLEQKLNRILFILGALPDSPDYEQAKERFETSNYSQ